MEVPLVVFSSNDAPLQTYISSGASWKKHDGKNVIHLLIVSAVPVVSDERGVVTTRKVGDVACFDVDEAIDFIRVNVQRHYGL